MVKLGVIDWTDTCEGCDDKSNQEDHEDNHEDDLWKTKEDNKDNKSKKAEYQMDTPRCHNKWQQDNKVFMDNSNKTKFVAENDVVGFENWLMDPGATSHVAKTTKKMFILKTAIDGECVTVGSNKTLKATAIKGVLDNHAGRLISV